MRDILVSGLAVVRNAALLDYPFIESIRSMLPVCDELVAVVGESEDDTMEKVRALDAPRVRIVETVWSDRIRPADCVLSQQTNIGLHLCRGVWCLHLQANEVLHEASLEPLRALMERHADDEAVEAMLLERLTFWADYEHVLGWYPDRFKFSPRIVRPYIGTYSIRDAMSFAIFEGFSTRGRYPAAIDTGAYMYRYGFVRRPEQFALKARRAVHRAGKEVPGDDFYLTARPRQAIDRFTGTHPVVMADRVASFPSQYDPADPRCRESVSWKERRRALETRWYERFGIPRWRNKRYRLIGDYRPKATLRT